MTVVPQNEALVVRSAAPVAVEESRAIAEVKAALFAAQTNPRDEVAATKRIIQDCGELVVAAKACYTYARGGTNITGPSIRMAELIARRWGNIQTGVRELEQRDGESVVQTFCWDVETGFKDEKTFTVSHTIQLKDGRKKRLTDPRDIYEMVANQGARRKRACILAVIPAHVVEAAIEQCGETLAAKEPVTPERLKAMLEKFAEYGIARAQIEARFQRTIDALTPAQFVMLRGIYNALKDGIATPVDHFDPIDESGGPKTRAEEVKAQIARRTPAAGTASARDSGGGEAPEVSAQPDETPKAHSALERDVLRMKIAEAWEGREKGMKAHLTRMFAKSLVPDLTTEQMADFLEHTPALLGGA
ncbi:MAG: hypothetical protein KGL39_37170 [Patescibacteria group bacterium]|nr:hypothetical protein [Patescibacteria group bacterium]